MNRIHQAILLFAASVSLASVTISQAADTTMTASTAASTTTATANNAESATASAAADTASAAASTAAKAKDEPKIPQDPPQVQKLIALYPNLIARIAPQGKVCFEGQECDISITAALGAADPNQPREGKVIYDGVCHTCHTAGLLGAPKFGDKGVWSARVGKGMNTLYDHAINGFNAMPAKGGNAELLDVEVTNAVDYMVENSK